MKIQLIKSLWGMEDRPLEDNLARIAASGLYTGIETGLPRPEETQHFLECLEQYKLDYVAMISTAGPDHYASFARQVEAAVRLKPLSITSHSLTDRCSDEELLAFFSQAAELQRQTSIPIGHETHRGRAMFTPWTTAMILRRYPELRITADISHFFCVCESMLEDEEADLLTIAERTVHIHARVGYAEGPQVPHPAAPEYAPELAAHERWWERMLNFRSEQGFAVTTVTPEFGPPGYLHTLPFTRQPVADLWEVCAWMAERFRSKYNRD